MKLPRDVSGDRLVRALGRAGFYVDHQVGSHVTLRHRDRPALKVVVPVHTGRPLKPKVLHRILATVGLNPEDLRELL
ncbi:MAG: type II toxin-antitoxin system HicA family toxin [candidate division NC10 bacterium]|nr:type II toxin-antitoxin system HicA family toxin [candidate division NC10 bacterium]